MDKTESQTEIVELKAELRRVTKERDILKKAANHTVDTTVSA